MDQRRLRAVERADDNDTLGDLADVSVLRQQVRDLERANAALRRELSETHRQLDRALADIEELCVDAGDAHSHSATLAARRQADLLERAQTVRAARARRNARTG